MTATAPSKPWRLRHLSAVDDPVEKAPRVQATRYLDRILQDGYQWMIGHGGRSCWVQHADVGPNDQATLSLDRHGRVAVTGNNRIANAVRRLLARGVEAGHLAGIIPNQDAIWMLRVDGLPDSDLGWRESYRPTATLWGGTTPVVVARELARSWQPHGGVAVITHLTAGGELRVRYDGLGNYQYNGVGEVPTLLGFGPTSSRPSKGSASADVR